MTNTDDWTSPLTAGSSVGDWLADAEGGAVLRELLAGGGVDASALDPVRNLPLRRLAELSSGLPAEVLDDLVRRVNGGVLPAEPEPGSQPGQGIIVPGRFEGHTVIVTGAASGIGRATAFRILREGGRVIGADLSADRLAELPAELDGVANGGANGVADRFVAVEADITDPAAIERVVAAADGQIHGLANVAGIVDDFSPIHETSDELWQRVLAVNLDGMFRLTRAVLPAMLRAGRGSIVNIASEAALRGNAAGAAYTASKHAVVGLTKNAAFMYAPYGIRVNAVAPGGVATGLGAGGRGSEFGRQRTEGFLRMIPPVATAEQLAASVTFLLSDDGTNISGAILPSDGGWSVQ